MNRPFAWIHDLLRVKQSPIVKRPKRTRLVIETLEDRIVPAAAVAFNDGMYLTHPNTMLSVSSANGVLTNDTDVDNNTLTASVVTNPSHGMLMLMSNGSFTYTPTFNYSGTDSFTYKAWDGTSYSNIATVSLNVTNTAPVAVNDGIYNTHTNVTLNVSSPGIKSNDTDADGDALAPSVVSNVSHGSLMLYSNGSFSYMPTTNYSGTDSFTYKVYDGAAYSNTATVSIFVGNHAPVATGISNVAALQGRSTSIDLSGKATDADGDVLTLTIVQGPAHGSLTLNAGTGQYVYAANALYDGPDSFTFKANDGAADSNIATVSLIVAAGTFTWDGGGADNLASNRFNWSDDIAPIAGDDVTFTNLSTKNAFIDLAFPSSLRNVLINDTYTGDIDLQRNFAVTAVLAQFGGRIVGAADLSIPVNARYDLHGGALANTAAVNIAGTMNWSGGAMNGTGTTLILSGATLSIEDGSAKSINQRILKNEGIVDWNTSEVIATVNAELRNMTGATIYLYGDAALNGTAQISNAGTIRNYGESTFDYAYGSGVFTNSGAIIVECGWLDLLGLSFNDSGSIAVESGRLRLGAVNGTSTGTITLADEGEMEFWVTTYTHNGGICGTGAVLFTAGVTTIGGTFSAKTTSINGAHAVFNTNVSFGQLLMGGASARLQGNGNVIVTDQMNWAKGDLEGSGSFTIATAATANFISPDPKTIARPFENLGTVQWYDGPIELNNVLLTNRGTFKVLGDDELTAIADANFDNYSIVRKQLNEGSSSATINGNAANTEIDPTHFAEMDRWDGTTYFNVPFTHRASARVEVFGGNFQLASGSSAGVFEVLREAKLSFFGLGLSFAFNVGSQITNEGTVVIHNGVVSFNTDLTLQNLDLVNGWVTGSGVLTITRQFNWRGGGMKGTGTTNIDAAALVDINSTNDKFLTERTYNNFGKTIWGRVSRILRDRPAGMAVEVFSIPGSDADAAYQGTTAAWNNYQAAIRAAHDNPNDPNATTLYSREAQAYQTYQTAMIQPGTIHEDAILAADQAYEQAWINAEDAHTPGDPASDEQYFATLSAAEDVRDALIETATQAYVNAEIAAHNTYLYSVQNARDIFRQAISIAYNQYRASLRNAALHDGLSAQTTVRDVADYLNDILHGRVPAHPLPPGHAGAASDPTALSVLSTFSADMRASIAIAYRARFGVELEDDIQSRLGSIFNNNALDTKNQLHWGSTSPYANPNYTGSPSWQTSISTWFNEAASAVGNRVQDAAVGIANFATSAWIQTVSIANTSVQMMRDDPVNFLLTVGEVYINTTAVMWNQYTFGMIPMLNAHANDLVNSNGYYRAMQVGAIVAREAAIGFLTGGTGLVVGGTIRGLSLTARYVGPIASRTMIRLLYSQAGFGATRSAIQTARTIGCIATTAQRAAQPAMLGMQASAMYDNFADANAAIAAGDYEAAARIAGRSMGTLPSMYSAARDSVRMFNAFREGGAPQLFNHLAACFAAGTPIEGEFGARPIESYRAGDRVWARDEYDPQGSLKLQMIEECFVTEAPIWHIHVGGQVLRTTSEHPFWIEGKGWSAARDLQPGDVMIGRTGSQVRVEEVYETGVAETVYNFRVAEYHTYYVGDRTSWGFDVWAHNASCVGLYGSLRSSSTRPSGSQVNHLNQNAAYGKSHATGGIPYNQGACIYLQGGTNQVGSQHYIYHQELRAFWRPYRHGGTLQNSPPTNSEYARAVGSALRTAGVLEADIRLALRAARKQRIQFGFADSQLVPNIPLN